MIVITPLLLYKAALAIYVLAALCINLVAFLFSDFYRKRCGQPSPRLGFLAAIAMGAFLTGTVAIADDSLANVQLIEDVLLLGSGVLSIYSSSALYLAMRKERK